MVVLAAVDLAIMHSPAVLVTHLPLAPLKVIMAVLVKQMAVLLVIFLAEVVVLVL
jgi:hypothetical protein